MDFPVVVLVGRPNVGKSTLFNRITKSNKALVADFPGLTRDRQYGNVDFEDKKFIVVDTGGIGVQDQLIDTLMSEQSKQALAEADIIVFIVDGKAGLTPLDQAIAQDLRKLNKSVIVAVNKIDAADVNIAVSDFQLLGFDKVMPISATHGRGIYDFLEYLTSKFPNLNDNFDLAQSDGILLSIVGRPNVGKSTLINRILGEARVVVADLPGTTRDSISVPFKHQDQQFTLIDTAGIRKKGKVSEKIEKFSIIKTLESIKKSHVAILLIDAREGVTEQDLHILRYIIEAGRALLLAVNKWDGLTSEQKNNIKTALNRRLTFIGFAKIHFISALHGTGVGNLWSDIKEAYRSAMQRFSTAYLTRLLLEIVAEHAPPLVQGRRIKLRFAHAGGHNPPVIVIHGNQLSALPDSYKRYLANTFTNKLNLVGTPLKLEFKQNENPYAEKRNLLTPRQIRKRKRLMSFVKKK